MNTISVDRDLSTRGNIKKKVKAGRWDQEMYRHFGEKSQYDWFEDMPELYEGNQRATDDKGETHPRHLMYSNFCH